MPQGEPTLDEQIEAVKREIEAEIACGYDAEPETAKTLAEMRAVLRTLEGLRNG